MTRQNRARPAQEDYRLGVSPQRIELAGAESFVRHAVGMLEQGRRSFDFLSRELDPEWFNTETFVKAVVGLALRAPASRARVLVIDPKPLVERGHQLLEASLRFSSFIQIRQLNPETFDLDEEFFIVDRTGLMTRSLADSEMARICFHDPVAANRMDRRFTDLWEQSRAVADFRRLHL